MDESATDIEYQSLRILVAWLDGWSFEKKAVDWGLCQQVSQANVAVIDEVGTKEKSIVHGWLLLWVFSVNDMVQVIHEPSSNTQEDSFESSPNIEQDPPVSLKFFLLLNVLLICVISIILLL